MGAEPQFSTRVFVLQEGGVPQTIRYCSRESDLPLTVGLLADTRQSQNRVLEPERRASYTFLDQVLRGERIRPLSLIVYTALRNQYSIGYALERKGVNGEYRKIKLTTKQPGMIVQTRTQVDLRFAD